MKAVFVVVLAVVAVCQAGVLPLSAGLIGAPAISPLGLGLAGHGLIGAPIATPLAAHWAAPIAAPVAVAAAVPAGAPYVAANRGSVHVAPLPGHLIGSKQLNLAPAPGTW